MNSTTVFLVLYYGGELRVNDDFIPTYIGGKNRPIQIPRRISFEELQKQIMKSLKIDPTKFFVNLVGRFPVGAGFIATRIDDEEVSETILTAACASPIVVYVEVMELMGGGREINNTEECDRARTSTGYIAPASQLSTPVECYGSEAREHDFFAGTSSAVMGELEDNEINVEPTEDIGYETMSSGSSSDDDEEVVVVDSSQHDREPAINRYMRWYRSWVSLYMLKAPTNPPDTYYPRAPTERLMRDHILNTEDIFRRYFGRGDDTECQTSFNEYEELLVALRRDMHISDTRYRDTDIPGTSASAQSDVPSMDMGPSSVPVVGQSTCTFTQPPQYSYQEVMWSQMHPWNTPVPSAYGPPSFHMTPPYGVYHGYSLPTQASVDIPHVTELGSQHPVEQMEEEDHRHHHLRDRPRRPPSHYTPGSDAIPPRRHRRR